MNGLLDEVITEENILALKQEWCKIEIRERYGQMTDVEYIAMRLRQQLAERIEAQIKNVIEIDTNEATMLTTRGSVNALRWIIGDSKQ